MPTILRRSALPLALLALATAGCKDEPPPACRLAQATPLPPNPLTLARDGHLLRAGDAFVLATVDGDVVRWARLSPDGRLGESSELRLPADRAVREEPWLGLAGKAAAGDQLVALFVALRAGAQGPPQYDLLAVTQTAGAAPSAPRRVLELPAGVDPAIVRLAVGTSRSAMRTALVIGYEGQALSPQIHLLKADAEPALPMPLPLYARAPLPRWDCLSVVPGRGDLAISVIEPRPSGKPGWHLFELREDGGRGLEYLMTFEVTELDCPVVAPTPLGYVLGYRNKNGVFFAEFDVGKSVVNSSIVAGALEFGGPLTQPAVAGVTAMGREYGLLLERPRGHEAWRFDAFGRRHGKPLALPARAGSVGPLSASVTTDAIYATYRDEAGGTGGNGGNSTQNQRYFIQVDCPEAPPLVLPPDGGADGGDAGK